MTIIQATRKTIEPQPKATPRHYSNESTHRYIRPPSPNTLKFLAVIPHQIRGVGPATLVSGIALATIFFGITIVNANSNRQLS
jgi:hypothetical protein